MDAASYEKLGAFYLGKEWSAERGLSAAPLLYDAKDLTTHALVVGMTGSGKTGLSVGILEEAAIDGIPAIVIDPKGDMGNLLLTFPELRAEDFEPWVDSGAATRAGKTVQEHAAGTATLWREGLGEWGQSAERIRRFRDSVDLTIYTPGSSAGLPLSVLRSFEAPPASEIADGEAFGQRIQVTVSGLLALLGMHADPITSREHVLLCNLLDRAWRGGRSLDLAGLIAEIQNPPFDKLGVIELETFYPAGERTALALKLNNLLASPGFGAWMTGEPLDAGRLLYGADGRPRISIVSIAHLGDSERMFVVSLLLNEILSWMRQQGGTSSLRALLYMDEIFGFFPPSAAPPSKAPMLTLLKQARAYGLGVVLATQNPVDLDYKGLSNCGTWFIGRLQTERDKARVLDGLEGAAQSSGDEGFDRSRLADIIGSLGKRVFLMNNVHDDSPAIFQTRWVLSYLRGPLVRSEIERLMKGREPAEEAAFPAATTSAAQAAAAVAEVASAVESEQRPVVASGVDELYLAAEREPDDGARLLLRPVLYAEAQLHFKNATAGVDLWSEVSVLTSIAPGARRLDWEDAEVCERELRVGKRKPAGFAFASLSPAAAKAQSFSTASKRLKTRLYQTQSMTFFSYKPLRLKSVVGESEGEFRQRVVLAINEKRDLEVEKLRARFAKRTRSLESKLATAEERYERETSQLRDRKLQTAVTIGTSLLGAVFGRKLTSRTSGAARAIRDVGRSRREKDDVGRAEERLEDLQEQLAELEREAEEAIAELRANTPDPSEIEFSERRVRPLKSDLIIDRLGLLWTPWQIDADGVALPLFSTGGRALGALEEG